ncbi:MAG: HAD family hydrolase [Vampirovibrionales bacterium]|nr:HAD family hydrolase [Vampirovibrionales bacterium]
MTLACFLDRDGTLNQEKGYIRNVDDLALIEGAAHAVKRLNDAGVLAILTTNQTGAARGFYDEAHIQALHNRLEQLLWDEAEAKLDAIFYCPHYPRGVVEQYATECTCRKPAIAMITQACEAFPAIELAQSVVMGDKASDIELAHNAGCQSVLLKTGYGQAVLDGRYQSLTHQPTWVCDDVLAGVETFLAPAKASLLS